MPFVPAPDNAPAGRFVSVPDESDPGTVLPWLKEAGVKILRGIPMGLGGMYDFLASGTSDGRIKVDPKTLQLLPAEDSHTGIDLATKFNNAVLPLPAQQAVGPVPSAILTGAGAGAVSGAETIPQIIKAAIASGGGSGVAEKLREEGAPEWLTNLAGFATGATAGGVMTRGQPAAEARIRSALTGTTPGDFQTAADNLRKFQTAGSTTATLAEALPGNNGLISLVNEARNQPGGETLNARLVNRPADLQGITNNIVSQSGPAGTVPAVVANQARDAAQNVIDNAMRTRTNQYTRDLNGMYQMPDGTFVPTTHLDPGDVANLKQRLVAAGNLAQSETEAEPYFAAARSLDQTNPLVTQTPATTSIQRMNGGAAKWMPVTTPPQTVEVTVPKTDVGPAILDLKAMREKAANPLTAATGTKLDQYQTNQRYQDVDNFLKNRSLGYTTAEGNYQKFSNQVVDPLVHGPIGDISGRNPNSIVDPSSGVLGNILKDQTPATIPGIMQILQSGAPSNSALLPGIVKTIVANKLLKGSTNPGQVLRGAPGSLAEQQLESLYGAAGVPFDPVRDSMDATDRLQNFQSPAAPGMTPNAPLGIRWMKQIDNLLHTKYTKNYYGKIAELLAEPDPATIPKLQDIMNYDPRARLAAALQGGVMPALLGGGQ